MQSCMGGRHHSNEGLGMGKGTPRSIVRIGAKTRAPSGTASAPAALLLVLAGCLSAVLGSCFGVGGDSGGVTCTPPPEITSSPPTVATVGQQYVYVVDARYLCGMWNICNNVVGVQMPGGASIDPFSDAIVWTPDESQANLNVRFTITTEKDDCGHVARQSWTVHVFPPPAS